MEDYRTELLHAMERSSVPGIKRVLQSMQVTYTLQYGRSYFGATIAGPDGREIWAGGKNEKEALVSAFGKFVAAVMQIPHNQDT